MEPRRSAIVTASDDNTARIWNAESGQAVRALAGHQERVYSAVFSADGRLIVTGLSDGTARIWDAESGQEVVRSPDTRSGSIAQCSVPTAGAS